MYQGRTIGDQTKLVNEYGLGLTKDVSPIKMLYSESSVLHLSYKRSWGELNAKASLMSDLRGHQLSSTKIVKSGVVGLDSKEIRQYHGQVGVFCKVGCPAGCLRCI
ncbi:hypothetical protein AVEN_274053-1 [Araneus ventricosus]|uniref:Uncharacterized protein n=1 Tax=Araneus ventricosus TaxID=182803 RepID=A0A4Y2MFG2_ARAVE|nr:hypothetical protein AVEN_274053-1 [Araneus ventricosus]